MEALLILSEWPPRAMLVEDMGLVSEARPVSPCKHQDDVAWTNVALAVRIGQEVGLHDETTYAPANSFDWTMRRRVNAWIRESKMDMTTGQASELTGRVHECRPAVSGYPRPQSKADDSISGRLGRDALIPSTPTSSLASARSALTHSQDGHELVGPVPHDDL